MMCKKDHTCFIESLQCLYPKILVNEMQRDIAEHFSDGNHSKFASELFDNDTHAGNCTTPSFNLCHTVWGV